MFNKDNNSRPDDFSEIIDDDDYGWGGDSGISINKLVQLHIDRISQFIFKSNSAAEYSERGKLLQKKSDSRETVIDAIIFLKALLIHYYDEGMKTKQKEIDKNLKDLLDKFLNTSVEKEAYLRSGKSKDNPQKAYEFWKAELKKNSSMTYDKDSMEYEYYLTMKHSLMMELFEEINLLLGRTEYLATKETTE